MLYHVTVETELVRFAGSLAIGVPAGLLLDVFRTLRTVLPHHAVSVFIEDTLFSFVSVFFVQCYVWVYADGAFRWYYAMGALLGLGLYLLTAGALWRRLLTGLRRLARRVVGAAKNSEKNAEKERKILDG